MSCCLWSLRWLGRLLSDGTHCNHAVCPTWVPRKKGRSTRVFKQTPGSSGVFTGAVSLVPGNAWTQQFLGIVNSSLWCSLLQQQHCKPLSCLLPPLASLSLRGITVLLLRSSAFLLFLFSCSFFSLTAPFCSTFPRHTELENAVLSPELITLYLSFPSFSSFSFSDAKIFDFFCI